MTRYALALVLGLCACDLYQDVGDGPADGGNSIDADTRDANLTDAIPANVGQPEPGRMSVTGRVYDLETGLPVSIATPNGDTCDLDNPTTSGPCSLRFALYDALAFANNPTGTPPIAFDSVHDSGYGALRDDGTFVAENIVPPQLGFLAIAVFDTGASDPWRMSWVAMPAQHGQLTTGVKLRALRTSTEQTWMNTADYPFGTATFSEVGVYLATFVDQNGLPVSGVKVTNAGAIEADKDYYFADTNPWTHTVIDPAQDATGANGSVLMVDVALSPKGGQESEPAGCDWPEDLGAAVPGTIMGQHRPAICP